MSALSGLTGIVFGAIFGSLFVITCLISAIKAVRDRSRIKKRRAMRKRNQLENTRVDGKNDCSIEDIQPSVSCSYQKSKPLSMSSDKYSNGVCSEDDFKERLDLSVYSVDPGVDNMTFQHSNINIKYDDESHRLSTQKSKATGKIVPSSQSMVPKRAKSHDANYRRKRNLDHLSADCLAIKKSVRRHSYELAVCENSWLPKEVPSFARSKMILDVYRYGGRVTNEAKSSKVAFENKAFDKNDYKKT